MPIVPKMSPVVIPPLGLPNLRSLHYSVVLSFQSLIWNSLCLYFLALTLIKKTQISCKHLSIWICLMFPHDSFQDVHLCSRTNTEGCLFFSLHLIRRNMVSVGLNIGCVRFDDLVKCYQTGFSNVYLLYPL